jgi:hypothetical protein
MERTTVIANDLRPLLGRRVVVRTTGRLLRGTLLSSVKGSAWLVVDDDDVVVPLADIVWAQLDLTSGADLGGVAAAVALLTPVGAAG